MPCHVPSKLVHIMWQGKVKTAITMVYNILTTVYTIMEIFEVPQSLLKFLSLMIDDLTDDFRL
jgi:DMSO/TMAO reductase YedYZ heme-binding membrane subunit